MPIFGAAYAAPNKGRTIYADLGLYQQCLVLQKIVEFMAFSSLFSDFPVLFKVNVIFKYISRKPLNSSTFQACVNPEKASFKNLHRLFIIL